MKKPFRFLIIYLAVLLFAQSVSAVSVFAEEDETASDVQSEYALVINIDSDTVLFERHAGDGNYCYCGFLSRIMTCAVLLEEAAGGRADLSQKVTLTSSILSETPKRRTETFSAGDTVTLEDLVKSALIANSQEACVAIAVTLDGSTEAFVERLNEKAQALGMTDTTITNVHGYFDGSDPGWTSLEDIVKAVKYALDQNYFKDFANGGEPCYITVSGTKKPLYYSNHILSSTTSYYNKKAVGIAAASSDNCTWYSACDMIYDGNQRIVTVVVSLKSLDTAWKDINTLLKKATVEYKTLAVLTKEQALKSVPVTRGKKKDSVNVVAATGFEATVSQETTLSDFRFEYDLPESVQAPVLKGDVLGEVRIYNQKGEYMTTVSLLAQTDVAADEIELFTDELNTFFRDWRVWAFIGGVIVLVLIYVIVSNRTKAKKKSRSRVRLRR